MHGRQEQEPEESCLVHSRCSKYKLTAKCLLYLLAQTDLDSLPQTTAYIQFCFYHSLVKMALYWGHSSASPLLKLVTEEILEELVD